MRKYYIDNIRSILILFLVSTMQQWHEMYGENQENEIGKGYLNFNGKLSKYMSKRSYTFYIIHFT